MDARRDPDSRHGDAKTAALSAAVFLFALALRLRGLGTVYPVNDEFMQFYEALARPGSWRDFFILLSHNPHHVLLDPLTTRLAAAASESLWTLRLPSALWGALGAWLTCRLGARAGRPQLGLAAGLLLSVSLLHLDWSRRADFYALLTAISVWIAVDFFSVLDHPESWPRLALSAAIFLLSHPYAVLMFCFQALYAAVIEKARRRETLIALAKAWGAAGVVFLPWFLFSTRALLNPALFDFRTNPAAQGFAQFMFGLPAALAQRPEAGPINAFGEAVFAVAYGAGWLVSLLGSVREKPSRLSGFSHALIGFGLAAVVAADRRSHYYFAVRQMLWVLPFFLITVADGWARILESRRARAVALAFAVFGALPLWRAATLWQEERTNAMDRLIVQMDKILLDRDALAFENDQLAAGFLFFFDRDAFTRMSDMRLAHGLMTYEFPAGFSAGRGGRTFSLSAGAPCAQDARAWTLCGSVYETTVLPPLKQPPSR